MPAGSAFVAPAKAFHGAGVATSGATRSAAASSSSCQMMARVPFIAGNWKMNPIDLDSAKDLAKAVSCAWLGLVRFWFRFGWLVVFCSTSFCLSPCVS